MLAERAKDLAGAGAGGRCGGGLGGLRRSTAGEAGLHRRLDRRRIDLLEEGQLLRGHHVARDLELAAEVELLRVRLAGAHVHKVSVGHLQGAGRLGGLPRVDGAAGQVEGPGAPRIGELELEDHTDLLGVLGACDVLAHGDEDVRGARGRRGRGRSGGSTTGSSAGGDPGFGVGLDHRGVDVLEEEELLRGEHVALDLELAAEVEVVRVDLAGAHRHEVGVADLEGALGLGRLAGADGAGLEIEGPGAVGILDLEEVDDADLLGLVAAGDVVADRREDVGRGRLGARRGGRSRGGGDGRRLGLGLGDLAVELDRGVGDDDAVALLDLGPEDHPGRRLDPHLGDQGLAREDAVGEADLDALELARVVVELPQDRPASVAEGAQAVEDRPIKAEGLGEVGVDVERVPVAAEAVEERLVGVDDLLDLGVGLAIRGDVDVGGGPSIAAPTTSAADERGQLVVDQLLPGLVARRDREDDGGVLALVEDVLDRDAVRQLGVRRQGPLELGVLLAVEEAVEAEVEPGRHHALLGLVEDRVDPGDHRVGRQRDEAVAVHLEDVAQLVVVERILGRADAEGVEGEIMGGVGGGDRLRLVAEREVDVDEAVAALARPGLDVREDRRERLGDLAGVGGRAEVDDSGPLALDVVGADVAAEADAQALGPLPAQLGEEAAADLEEAAALLTLLVGEPGDERADVLGAERVDQVLGEDGLGHPRAGDRGDGVDVDAALATLDREGVGQAVEAELGHRVVGLAEVAVDPGGGGRVDDPAVALLAHHRPRRVGDPERAEHVHLVDEVPVGLGHLGEGDVAEDAGVVDDDVDPAEGVDGGLDDRGALGDRVVVGDGLAAGGDDLRDDRVCRCGTLASAPSVTAEVVDDDLRPAAREEEGVGAAETVARASDDRDFAVVPKLACHDL